MRGPRLFSLIVAFSVGWGCSTTKSPEEKEEPLAQLQPGYIKSVTKLGVRYPEKKATLLQQDVPELEELCDLVEMDLAEDALAFGGFQVVDHNEVQSAIRRLREVRADFGGLTNEERFREASKACGLDAYVDLEIMTSETSHVRKAGGCLFPTGGKKLFSQMAGRVYVVDVRTGAIVGVKRFQYRHEGKLDQTELKRKVVSSVAKDISDWIRESP